jgi:hypothetical protein
MQARRRSTGHSNHAGGDGIGSPSQSGQAEARGLFGKGCDLIFRQATQRLARRRTGRRQHDQIAQTLEQVFSEAMWFKAGFDH